jgi:hypothetical protein
MLCRDMNKCEEVRKEIVLSTKNKWAENGLLLNRNSIILIRF